MALDCTLTCVTRASEGQIRDTIARACDATVTLQGGVLRFTTIGLIGTVLPCSELSKELTYEAYGFTPTTEFLFRLDKFEQFQSGLVNFASLCISVIRDLAEDCVLRIGEGESVLLRRKKELLLKRSDDHPSRKALLTKIADAVGSPYSFGDVPEL